MNKAFPKVPGGSVLVENPDGVTRTYGDGQRNSLYDADWINGPLPEACSYGAFPSDSNGANTPYGLSGPTMRKPVNE